ncbi:MAG: hypothetical protein IV090_19820 [Candidatus Sericytochromatia bacterium]|nr:hypothetical protein [Candidatus Sericytochromatia bacterium]
MSEVKAKINVLDYLGIGTAIFAAFAISAIPSFSWRAFIFACIAAAIMMPVNIRRLAKIIKQEIPILHRVAIAFVLLIILGPLSVLDGEDQKTRQLVALQAQEQKAQEEKYNSVLSQGMTATSPEVAYKSLDAARSIKPLPPEAESKYMESAGEYGLRIMKENPHLALTMLQQSVSSGRASKEVKKAFDEMQAKIQQEQAKAQREQAKAQKEQSIAALVSEGKKQFDAKSYAAVIETHKKLKAADPQNTHLDSLKSQSQDELAEQVRAASEAKKVLEVAGEKPENSAWDGSVKAVKNWMKANLPDPDSTKDEEWWKVVPTKAKDGLPCWGVRAQFRTKNQFGAYELVNMYFHIRHNEVIEVTQ